MNPNDQDITVAILAKDKAATLPLYLSCLAAQTFPKDRIRLYIRANDSSDDTNRILQEWVSANGHLYREVYSNYGDLDSTLRSYANHEWNAHRFSVLGAIRQESVDWARDRGTHYFVADLDNFIRPDTLQRLHDVNLPVVGPLLRTTKSAYSNYHLQATDNGYYQECPEYYAVLERRVRGLINVDVIHCTYFVQHGVLGDVRYLDDSGRHEYVIFSDTLRRKKIPQYIDNREVYGLIAFLAGESEQWHGGFDEKDFTARLSKL
jgi:glycosyltransferase involved in cell wall biosynthesis